MIDINDRFTFDPDDIVLYETKNPYSRLTMGKRLMAVRQPMSDNGFSPWYGDLSNSRIVHNEGWLGYDGVFGRHLIIDHKKEWGFKIMGVFIK
jgi:hypothetical protein